MNGMSTWSFPNGNPGIAGIENDRSVKVTVVGGGGGGGPVTIADGADTTEGSIADAAVTTNSPGTLSAKLRGIVALLAAGFTFNPPTSNTVSAAGPTTVGAASVQLLAANASRKKLILQNVGVTRIWILFGAGAASSSNYHISLPAGGSANDGSSLPYIDTLWQGAIATRWGTLPTRLDLSVSDVTPPIGSANAVTHECAKAPDKVTWIVQQPTAGAISWQAVGNGKPYKGTL